jgi:hypothetical protein
MGIDTIFILAIIAGFILVIIKFNKSKTKVSLTSVYESCKHGISFDYPNHWKVQVEDALEGFSTLIVRITGKKSSQGMSAVSVLILPPVSRSEGGIDSYLKSSQAQFANVFPGFKPHSYKQAQILGHDGAWMEHSYDGANGRVREAVVTAFIDQQHFSHPLQFVFEAPQAKFSEGMDIFKQLLESVEISQGELKGNVSIVGISAEDLNDTSSDQEIIDGVNQIAADQNINHDEKDFSTLVKELAGVTAKAEIWCQNNPGNAPSKCPQRDQIRNIGQQLHELGGIELMREAHGYVNSINDEYGYFPEIIWSGVGDWLW